MLVKKIFEVMCGVIESLGYLYLKYYWQDFYEYDCWFIEWNYLIDVSYLWIVWESGIYFIVLGVYLKMCEEGFVVMELFSVCDLYFVK